MKNSNSFSHPHFSSFIFHVVDIFLMLYVGVENLLLKLCSPGRNYKLESSCPIIFSLANQTFLESVTKRLIFPLLSNFCGFFFYIFLHCTNSHKQTRVFLIYWEPGKGKCLHGKSYLSNQMVSCHSYEYESFYFKNPCHVIFRWIR